MLVYSESISSRLRYTCDFIGKEVTGEPFKFTDSKEVFRNFPGPRINYSAARTGEEEYWFRPHALLFETGTRQQTIHVFETGGQKAFFKTEGDLSFDIFAAIFYLLSRYEEYLPHRKDAYGRYDHQNSLAFREGFLDKPLINTWLEEFKRKLKDRFPSLNIQHSSFTFLPTYDIDEAWSYKHKAWRRRTGAGIKELLRGNWDQFMTRKKVVKGTLHDPFDSYEWMDKLHQQYKLKPRYFFLVPERTGKYDRNILPAETAFQQLIQQHAAQYETGIHPSWQSGDDPGLLKKEIQTLSAITGKKTNFSRQHYIRFTLPQTFRYLVEAGIKEDFSMGYGSINGFRASVASPFYWYDLEKEEPVDLLIYPFCYMEANSFYEQKFSAGQALEEIRHYYAEVKKVNGTLITIWHNTFLGTDERFKGWREIYKRFVEESQAVS